MEVATESIAVLIGKRGAKVHSMMEESGAKIFISNLQGQDSSTRQIAIRGPPEAIEKAKELIQAQITYAKTNLVARVFERVLIPSKHIGHIIGKAGARIKDLEAQSGAKLNIEDIR